MTHPSKNPTTEQIWRDLSDRLRGLIRSRIPSAADGDDVLQTVFLRIHARLDALRDSERLEPWVFQIARNAIADHYRAARGTQTDVESLAVDDGSPAESTAHRELAACLGGMMEQLPADQRRALSMYEFEELAQKEIARREAISLSGAKSRVQRGRAALLRLLKECCEFEFDRRGNLLKYAPLEADRCDECA